MSSITTFTNHFRCVNIEFVKAKYSICCCICILIWTYRIIEKRKLKISVRRIDGLCYDNICIENFIDLFDNMFNIVNKRFITKYFLIEISQPIVKYWWCIDIIPIISKINKFRKKNESFMSFR